MTSSPPAPAKGLIAELRLVGGKIFGLRPDHEIAAQAAVEIENLCFALATVLGDAEHGQNMSWGERCKIGREALDRLGYVAGK